MSVALITGATGLVGSHIAELLLEQGWTVRALARSDASAQGLLPGIEAIMGDVLDEASFRRAATGCHVVFHAAANIITHGGWDAYRVTNVEGARNAIAAAEGAKARLLHVSSVAVYGSASRYDAAKRGEKTDERTLLAPLSERAYYARSKRDSEAMVLDAHRQGRVWATAIRPDVVYGKRDRQFVPRMAALLRYMPIPLLNGGRSTLAIVHAANVAQGAVLAATSDRAGGNVYNLANDFDVTVRQFFELAGRGLGRRPFFVPMPMWLARRALQTAKSGLRLLTGGRFNLISNSAIDFIAEDNPFSSERAKRELGWAPTVAPTAGVVDAFRWFGDSQRV
ncbi:MAG: NAD-dependent epimerase/dehydratase family protein [Gemmatimonadota bacterium]